MTIEEIAPANIKALTQLMLALWPDCDFKEEYDNCKRMLDSAKEICYLVNDQGQYIAFIYLSLRNEYVEGSQSSPIAYIEGIYVKPSYRKKHIGQKLVELGAEWGRQKGCTQYASDTECTNLDSIVFHKKAGFKEVNRVVCFLRDLS